jgi:hypothetical protein
VRRARLVTVRTARSGCRSATGVDLDGDHPRAGGGQRRRQCPEAGAEVEDQIAGADAGRADDLSGDPWQQEVRTGRLPGHGTLRTSA